MKFFSLIIFLLLIADNPSERPYMGLTETPLLSTGEIFYRSLGKLVGVPNLKIFTVEIFVIFSFLLCRKEKTSEVYKGGTQLLLCLLFLTLYGLINGGSLRFAALQIRPLICLIFFCFLLQSTATKSTIHQVENLIIASCIARCVYGIYLWLLIFRNVDLFDHSMGDGSYVMSHSDSPLSVAAISIILVRALRHRKYVKSSIFSISIILTFCILNNRRIFFVELSASLLILFYLLNLKEKVTLKHKISGLIFSLTYSLWAWSSKSVLAYPIQTIKSSIMQSDASSKTRGVENYNLIYTIRSRPVLGQGFGHKYIEKIQAFDISHHFEAYEYVPHNSTLWVLTSGGLLFATFYYNFFSLSAKIKNHNDSSIATIAIPILSAYFLHCFGDMGAQCWKTSVLVGTVLGCANAHTKDQQ